MAFPGLLPLMGRNLCDFARDEGKSTACALYHLDLFNFDAYL
jgi:hypothetical protein